MRFFFLQDFQHWLLALFLGLVLAILVYLGLTAYADSKARAGQKAEEEFTYPDGIRAKNFPTPVFILFLYIGILIWAILYVVFVGMRGPI
jgi:Na+/H+ antiporter NhaC